MLSHKEHEHHTYLVAVQGRQILTDCGCGMVWCRDIGPQLARRAAAGPTRRSGGDLGGSPRLSADLLITVTSPSSGQVYTHCTVPVQEQDTHKKSSFDSRKEVSEVMI